MSPAIYPQLSLSVLISHSDVYCENGLPNGTTISLPALKHSRE